MKKLGLIFFFLAFAIKLNSQIKMSKGQLLVVKDSLSFYSFDLNGVASFIIENDSVKRRSYKEYSKTTPKEIINLESMSRLKSVITPKGEVYFLYPGGGLLFHYENNAIERLSLIHI